MGLTLNDDYRWNRVLDVEFSDGSRSLVWDASRACQLGKILIDPIVKRIKACFGKFENVVNFLEQTLNQVWSVLNLNSNEDITKNQKDLDLGKQFIVDDKIYYSSRHKIWISRQKYEPEKWSTEKNYSIKLMNLYFVNVFQVKFSCLYIHFIY